MRFVIARDGSTSNVTSSGDLPADLGQCLTKAFDALKFPEPKEGRVTTTCMVALTKKGDEPAVETACAHAGGGS